MQRDAAKKLGDKKEPNAVEKLFLRAAVKKISPEEAAKKSADLRADLSQAKDSKDLQQLADRARELQGRMSVSKNKDIGSDLRTEVRKLRNQAQFAA
jgi:hypothetical protein